MGDLSPHGHQHAPHLARMIRSTAALVGRTPKLGRRSLCYDLTREDAVVQSSASGRPQSRMVRKMIKEIFGHPMAPADCTVYLDEADSSTDILAVFHPCGSDVNVDSLGLGPNVREATQEEQSSISFWYTARVRIDHRVAEHTGLLGNADSEHVQFGLFATLPETPTPTVAKAECHEHKRAVNVRAPLRLNTLYRKK